MRKSAFYLILMLIVFLTAIVPLYGKGKSQDSPGQQKKEASHQTTSLDIGDVEQVTGNSVIIGEQRGHTVQAQVDRNTRMFGKNEQSLGIRQLRIRDRIAVISSESAETASSGGRVKKAIKIYVRRNASESAQLEKRAVQGIIQNIVGSVITLVHQIHHDRVYTIIVDAKTIVRNKNQAASGSASLAIGQRIVAIGDPLGNGSLSARLIHIIPGKAQGIFKRFPHATPSASVSPEASTSPTLEPSPTSSPSVTPIPTL